MDLDYGEMEKKQLFLESFLYFFKKSIYFPLYSFIFIIFPMTELYEKSAGGIVYRKKGELIEILMLAWKNARDDLEYVLPKGHIENDESPMETALREISEET